MTQRIRHALGTSRAPAMVTSFVGATVLVSGAIAIFGSRGLFTLVIAGLLGLLFWTARKLGQVDRSLQQAVDAATVLRVVGEELAVAGDQESVYDRVLDAASALMHSDFASVQLFHADRGELQLLGFRGFDAEAAKFWEWVRRESGSTCSEALRTGRRCIVPDVRECDFIAGTPDQTTYLRTGIRAAQSTPLLSRTGALIGMISTHWKQPHEPSPEDLRAFDALAREAADALARTELLGRLQDDIAQCHVHEAESTVRLQRQDDRLQELTSELTMAGRRERERLAALLHDDLQQSLVAAKLSLEIALRTPAGGGNGESHQLEHVAEMIDEAIATSRDLTRDLTPRSLHEGDLEPALRRLASETWRRHRLVVEVRGTLGPGPSSDDSKALLFESARELLLNVAKHAKAGRALLELGHDASGLRVAVEDDGQGLDAAASRARRQGPELEKEFVFGLFRIRERLATLGGSMSIRSSNGAGTRVELLVPQGPPALASPGDERPLPGAPGPSGGGPGPSDGRAIDRWRVIIADDHKLVREGIAGLLSRDARITVVAQVEDGASTIEAVRVEQPDLVILDVSMPRMNGIEAAREIHRRWPDVRILGLSSHEDLATEKLMLDAGAAAFVRKASPAKDFLDVVLRVVASAEASDPC